MQAVPTYRRHGKKCSESRSDQAVRNKGDVGITTFSKIRMGLESSCSVLVDDRILHYLVAGVKKGMIE